MTTEQESAYKKLEQAVTGLLENLADSGDDIDMSDEAGPDDLRPDVKACYDALEEITQLCKPQ